MSTYYVPTREQLTPEGQQVYDGIHQAFGKVPNLFATIGSSATTLAGLLQFQAALERGSFSKAEVQAIYLAVSEVNGCYYCLSAHTALGKMAGLTEADTLAARRGAHPGQPRLHAIVQLARAVALERGRPSAEVLAAFHAQGFDQGALVNLVALVGEKSLVNYIHNITQVPIDWPLVSPLAPEIV